MYINWPIIILLVSLSLPGIIIYIPRLINFLLKTNSDELKKRVTRFAIIQSVIMVFVMSIAGSLLSHSTALSAPILNPLLQGQATEMAYPHMILPVFLTTFLGLFIYYTIERHFTKRFVSKHNLSLLNQYRTTIQLDGIVLYQGVVDEIIGRWGLLNVLIFFGLMITGPNNMFIIYCSILISSILFSISKLPVFISAGCKPSRPFFYYILTLYTLQSILFSYIFWRYGLVASILSHMAFLCGLWFLNKPQKDPT